MDRKARVICLAGFMGCGKSTVGKILASRTGAAFTDLDVLVTEREGRSIPEIFGDGETAFRKAELEALEAYLEEAGREPESLRVLALGGGTMTTPEALDLVLSRTESVYLRCTLDTIRERLGGSDPSRPLFADAERLFAARKGLYERAGVTVDADGRTPETIAGEIICTLLP